MHGTWYPVAVPISTRSETLSVKVIPITISLKKKIEGLVLYILVPKENSCSDALTAYPVLVVPLFVPLLFAVLTLSLCIKFIDGEIIMQKF